MKRKSRVVYRKPISNLANLTRLVIAMPLLIAAKAQAIEFYAGPIEASLDTQVSFGSSWRVEKPDEFILADANANDGDANYGKNDAFSQVFKGSNDLQASYKNFGAFLRTKYWYDVALENDDTLNDSNNHNLAKYSGIEIFDAFVYGEFEILDMPLDLRLGKQVVSWGESTFILGGLGSINSFDASALNRPGAKIKEALIPVNMAFANIGLSENLSAEAFYQLEFRETVLDGCGTYFSDVDYASPGCPNVETPAGNISRDANHTRRPNSDGQFGMALRYVSQALDTEFGFYAMNIHSRNPLYSTTKANFDGLAALKSGAFSADIQGVANFLANGTNAADATAYNNLVAAAAADPGNFQAILDDVNTGAASTVLSQANAAGSTFYFEYPEDMQIAGLSFATNFTGIALSGEMSHTLDAPMQINATQLTEVGLSTDPTYALFALNAELAGATQAQAAAIAEQAVATSLGELGTEFMQLNPGQASVGFKLFDVTQLQMTAIKLFDQVLGASRVTLVAEAGYTHIHGLNDNGGVKFGGTAFTNADGITYTMVDTVTQNSWGYSTLISAEYSDVFAGVSLTPEIYWSQDVKGVSPATGSGFNEGDETLGVTITADYLNTYNAAISYTQLSGGPANYLSDRDFASISVGMQF